MLNNKNNEYLYINRTENLQFNKQCVANTFWELLACVLKLHQKPICWQYSNLLGTLHNESDTTDSLPLQPVAFNIQDLSTKGFWDVPGFSVAGVSRVILDLFEVPPLYIHMSLVHFSILRMPRHRTVRKRLGFHNQSTHKNSFFLVLDMFDIFIKKGMAIILYFTLPEVNVSEKQL